MRFNQLCILIITLVFLLFNFGAVRAQKYDIIVWGAGNSGISAAIAGAEKGNKTAIFFTNKTDFSFLLEENITSVYFNDLTAIIKPLAKEKGLTLAAAIKEKALISESLKQLFSNYKNLDFFIQRDLMDLSLEDKIITQITVGGSNYIKEIFFAKIYIDATSDGELLTKALVPLQIETEIAEDFSRFVEGAVKNAKWDTKALLFEDLNTVRAKGYYRLSALNAIATEDKQRPNIQKNTIAAGQLKGALKIEMESGESYSFLSLPFTVPYFTIIPQKIDNLLIANAFSTTKLGQVLVGQPKIKTDIATAAGLAASLCVTLETTAKKLPVELLQRELLRKKQAIVHFNDITANSPYFEISQYFGLRGYLNEASFNAEELLSEKRAKHWQFLSNQEAKLIEGKTTKGAFLQQLYKKIKEN